MTKMVLAMIALVILTVAGLVNIYQAMFDFWMTTDPSADANEWRMKFYIRLGATALIMLLWMVSAIWLFRLKSSYKLYLQKERDLASSSHSISEDRSTVD